MKKIKIFGGGKVSALLLGALFSLLLVVGCSAIASFISLFLDDPTGHAGILSIGASLIAGALSGFILGRRYGDGGVRHSALCTGLCALLMTVIGAIISGGLPNASALINHVCFIGVGVLFSMLGKKRQRRRRIRSRR